MSTSATATLDRPARVAPTVRRGMDTPWGQAQQAGNILPGLGWVSTASHGGYCLSTERNLEVPEYMRSDSGWYEEDCAYVIVLVVFEAELLASDDEVSKRLIQSGEHKDTFRNWHPEAYEKFYGVKLSPGESFLNDQRLFFEEHAQDLLVVSAFGDWHERVPKGMVGVVARTGGSWTEKGTPERYFLVPGGEYDQCKRFAFIVDPARHEEIEKFC